LTRVPAYRTPTEQLTGGYPRRSKRVDDNVTRTKSTGGYRTTPAITHAQTEAAAFSRSARTIFLMPYIAWVAAVAHAGSGWLTSS
jgi:hypothetical protein